MKITKPFSQLSKHDANIAGGKGASLGEMTQAGIPVPPGFVILAESFDKFLEINQIKDEITSILKKVEHQDIKSINIASKELRDIILKSDFPEDIASEINFAFTALDAKFIAVRSSATAEDSSDASWAGELESYLNITKDDLLDAVRKCWASLFTPRAIFYRIEKNLHLKDVSVAVVVQKMVQSEVSGITFTVHPVTQDHNQMVIEAGWGLGEAIVGGMITPDNYVILKNNLQITDKYISEQLKMITRTENIGTEEISVPKDKQEIQKLEDDHIIELANICLDIEKHYGFPCDIEWAIEKEKIYIVQSRPITTL